MTGGGKEHEYLDSIGRRLNFATSAVDALTAELLREHDLSPVQWVALSVLWRRDGITVNALAAYMRATAPATSRLLGRMEERGLIERRTVDEDRRILQIRLTKKGWDLEHLRDLHEVVNNLVMDGLTASERTALSAGLERIAANAAKEVERARSS
jgi:DNA-binding MarR family transcriptional regulator